MIDVDILDYLDTADIRGYSVNMSSRMRNALIRVIEVHRSGELPETPCHDCDQEMPCPTVQAIAQELGITEG